MTTYPCDGPMHDDAPVKAEIQVTAFANADTKFLCPMCFAIMGYQVGVDAGLWPDGLLKALEDATAADADEAPAEVPEPEIESLADTTEAPVEPVTVPAGAGDDLPPY